MKPHYCPKCDHAAEKHAGEQGCIGRNADSSDCWCSLRYRDIALPPDWCQPEEKSARSCSLDGCTRPVKGYGMCDTHYQRWRRPGKRPVLPEEREARAAVKREKSRVRAAAWLAANPERAATSNAAYYAANHEKLLASSRARYRADPQKANAQNRAWRAANRERFTAHIAAYYQANKEVKQASTRAYYAANREKRLAYQAAYAAVNPVVIQANRWRYRARKVNAPVNDLTVNDWREVLEEYGHACAYCGRDDLVLEQDHVYPLSRGGSHTRSNVAPACRSCNAMKSDHIVSTAPAVVKPKAQAQGDTP